MGGLALLGQHAQGSFTFFEYLSALISSFVPVCTWGAVKTRVKECMAPDRARQKTRWMGVYLDERVLDVIINAVQDAPLLDHQHRQLPAKENQSRGADERNGNVATCFTGRGWIIRLCFGLF